MPQRAKENDQRGGHFIRHDHPGIRQLHPATEGVFAEVQGNGETREEQSGFRELRVVQSLLEFWEQFRGGRNWDQPTGHEEQCIWWW